MKRRSFRFDTDTQYGLLTDAQEPAGASVPEGPAGRRRLSGGYDNQPLPLARQPQQPDGAFDPYGLAEAPATGVLPPAAEAPVRPATLHHSPSRGGGRPAEVLSFLDDNSSGGAEDGEGSGFDPYGLQEGGAASGHVTGGAGGRAGLPPRAPQPQQGSLDPYGLGEGDGVLPSDSIVLQGSRPATAAPLAGPGRESAADLPRLASPALSSLLPPGPGEGGSRPLTATRVSHDHSEDGGGAGFDPYGEVADSPATLLPRRRVSGGGTAAGAGVASASGPALLTSFGEVLQRPGGGSGGSGGRPLGAPPTSAGGRGASRLSSASGRAAEDEYDPYGDDGRAGDGVPGTAAGGQGGGGGGLLFNTSLRSQPSAKDRLGTSIRSDRYGGGAGPGVPLTRASSSGESALGGVGSGKGGGAAGDAFDPYGLGGEQSGGAGGKGVRGPASGTGSRKDEGEGLLEYDEAELGGGDEIDYGLGAEDGGGDDF